MHVEVLHIYGVSITLDVSLVVPRFGNFAVLIPSSGLMLLVQLRTNRALFGLSRLYFKSPRGGKPTDEKLVQESNAGKVRARNHLIVEHGTSKLHCVSQECVQTLGYPEFHLT